MLWSVVRVVSVASFVSVLSDASVGVRRGGLQGCRNRLGSLEEKEHRDGTPVAQWWPAGGER